MGQKINPNIFRLNNTNDWKYKYFEKKSTETAIYTFKNLEIENFITKFFKIHGLAVHEIKLYHFNSVLHVFVSYFLTPKTTFNVNLNNKNIKLILEQTKIRKQYIKNRIKIKKNIKRYTVYDKFNYLTHNKIKLSNKKKLSIKRIKLLQQYKKNLAIHKYQNISNIKTNFFLEKILESLTLFVKKKHNIALTVKQLNNNIKQKIDKKEQKIIKKNLIKLRKYNRNKFFKEGINTFLTCLINKNSAKLLSKFIAKELQSIKKHNFFLKFIKTTLTLFFNNKFSKCKGMKIKIKGRFNGAPRARDKFIYIGNGVPALTIDSKISYAEDTSFTPNGTFGVKVWINEEK
jgi:ribosomal protein S3